MERTIKVTGMSCMHCVGAVTRALEKVPGVETATVSLEKGLAVVTGNAEPAALIAAIEGEGYGAKV